MLCVDLDEWDGGGVGGRFKREGIYVYIELIHFSVQKKLTQHCKATLLLFSHQVTFDSLRPHGLQHAGLLCLPLSPGICSNRAFLVVQMVNNLPAMKESWV